MSNRRAKKQKTSEEANNMGLELLAIAKYRARFPDGDPFVAPSFGMSSAAKEKHFMFTILIGFVGEPIMGTFGRDNFASLPHFVMEHWEAAQTGASVIARRFEPGPKEPISGFPYKTLGSAIFMAGEWHFLTEEQMKVSHTTDATTDAPIPVEAAVLFSTIPEMLPNFSDEPELPPVEMVEI